MERTIDEGRDQETNVATKIEVTVRIESDIETKITMPNTGEGRDRAQETKTETSDTNDEIMNIRDHDREIDGGGRGVETVEKMTTLSDAGRTTRGRVAKMEILEGGAGVDLVRPMSGDGVAMIDDRRSFRSNANVLKF